MLYIHQSSCISPQQTFGDVDIEHLHLSVNNQMLAIEPAYKNIPPGILRRMSKTVKVGIAAAMPLLENIPVNGIIIGTANGGMEESIKFLNQMIEYDEGLLTPGDFVQSTSNAVASQISLMTGNKAYNTTHVHRGFSFENALIDAAMLVKENPDQHFLVGGVDVISSYNYNIDALAGCYKNETASSADLYVNGTQGTIAGEGAAMFIVNSSADASIAKIDAVEMYYSNDAEEVKQQLDLFLRKHLRDGEEIDLLLSGEDGDSRSVKFYEVCTSLLKKHATVARFKHMTGDFATVSAIGLWLCCYVLQNQRLPQHMIKRQGVSNGFKKVLVYNAYRQHQHSFILLSTVS